VGLRDLIGSTAEENDTHTQAMAFKHMLMWIGQATLPPIRCPRHLSYLHLRRLPRPEEAEFRPDLLTDPGYWTDEPIDDD
jgi:hypothetical protein